MRAVLQQIDELEHEFDKVRRIRGVVKNLRFRVEGLDRRVSDLCPKNRWKSRSQREQPESNPRQVSQTHSAEPRVHKPLTLNSKDKAALLPNTVPMKPGRGYDQSQSSTSVFKLGSLTDIARLGAVPDLLSSSRSIDHGANNSTTCHMTSDGSTTWSISTEDTNDTGSENSEDWCSPVEWQHHLILEAVMAEFYTMFHQGHISGAVNSAYGQSGSTSSAQSSSSTNGSSSSANQSSASSTNNTLGPKRPNQDGDFPPPEEGQDGNKRPRILLTTTRDNNDKRRYACPFFKHDPCKHGQRGSCTGPGFKSIPHLKYV